STQFAPNAQPLRVGDRPLSLWHFFEPDSILAKRAEWLRSLRTRSSIVVPVDVELFASLFHGWSGWLFSGSVRLPIHLRPHHSRFRRREFPSSVRPRSGRGRDGRGSFQRVSRVDAPQSLP